MIEYANISEDIMGRRVKDLMGKRFGYLTVIGDGGWYVKPSGERSKKWLCKCDCGNETSVVGDNLTRGRTLSCGCMNGKKIWLVPEPNKFVVLNSNKKVLVACEESQAVCKAFRDIGWDAFSCDIQMCSGGHPEWHIKGDVLPLIDGDCSFVTMDATEYTVQGQWDMIIGFPPCTHLALSGTQWFKDKREDGRQEEAIRFFMKLWNAKCDRICLENPRNILSGKYCEEYFPELCEELGLPLKHNQCIQPWNFGHNIQKSTWLWLKGMPPLIPDITDKPELEFKYRIYKGRVKRHAKFMYSADGKRRSKTFEGIAKAMANQWGI